MKSDIRVYKDFSQNFRLLAERSNNHVMGESSSTPERRQSISPNIETRGGGGRFSR